MGEHLNLNRYRERSQTLPVTPDPLAGQSPFSRDQQEAWRRLMEQSVAAHWLGRTAGGPPHRYHAATSEETAAMRQAYLNELLHRQAAEEAGRRLAEQEYRSGLRMPTLEDIRASCAERTYEGRPLLSYDDDFLRSLGIRP